VRSEIAVDIAAPPDLVFRLVADPLRWPALLPHYSRARALTEIGESPLVAEFVARRPLLPILGFALPVAWRSRAWAEPSERRLRFQHLGGATSGMDVTWRIEPAGTGDEACRVTIEHDFRPSWPGGALWARVIERGFVRPIAGRTLAAFKAIAEAVRDEAALSPDGRPEQ
jgi:ribosome-associated toxin RatA of RatAB toxin-antitoxin module